jgi:hypothetical protein
MAYVVKAPQHKAAVAKKSVNIAKESLSLVNRIEFDLYIDQRARGQVSRSTVDWDTS